METTAVLNISNINADNVLVLNDLKLLQLIIRYPFLYNPYVRPTNDADYDEWAWISISEAFNKSYEPQEAQFTQEQLMQRWLQLKPILITISKPCHANSLPPEMRVIVQKITLPLKEAKPKLPIKTLTSAQKELLQNLDWIDKLPFDERRCLEADVMKLIITAELDAKSSRPISDLETAIVDNECKEFLKQIQLDELMEENEDLAAMFGGSIKNQPLAPAAALQKETTTTQQDLSEQPLFTTSYQQSKVIENIYQQTIFDTAACEAPTSSRYLPETYTINVVNEDGSEEQSLVRVLHPSADKAFELQTAAPRQQKKRSKKKSRPCKVVLRRNDDLESYMPLSLVKHEHRIWYS